MGRSQLVQYTLPVTYRVQTSDCLTYGLPSPPFDSLLNELVCDSLKTLKRAVDGTHSRYPSLTNAVHFRTNGPELHEWAL